MELKGHNKTMTNEELITKAASIINLKKIGDFLVGDVGCALITDKNNLYLGICANVASNSFCAEQNAIGAMITAGEYKIKKIVAVWKSDKGEVYILAPCGNCRELMRQIAEENLEAEVVLDKEKQVKLKELLTYYDWFHKMTK